ncbi:MAG: glycosyltransferase family 2 protein [Betaproteobacteria bacterium]|nr:glycosyltransferase family 2 protein [Betaproteobacteria bacterium]
MRDIDTEGAIGLPCLTVSLVTFRPDRDELTETLHSLRRACSRLIGWQMQLYLVDNTPLPAATPWLIDLADEHGAILLAGHGNVGFGHGHNLVLDQVGNYHLILNPDVGMAEDSLVAGLGFMVGHPECGLLTPAAFWADGSRQYLCKREPSLFDLLLRGFAPAPVKHLFARRLARYEMQDCIAEAVVWDPPIVSGCFMLFRGDVLRALGGFDPRYFLYFEDFDLSLRAGKVSRIAYVPAVRIVHHGGNAARKGWAHIRMFGRSAVTFFGTHGWRLW